MGVVTEYQAVVACDYCPDSLVEAFWTQKEAVKEARKMGWSVGKKVKCAKCRRRVK